MARIDELITEIYADEVVSIDEYMDEEQQKRIENRIFSAIGLKPRKHIPIRRFMMIGLAAILVMGLCITAFGATYPDWDIEILRIMGLSNTDTLQLESGEVNINESVVCNAVEHINEAKNEKQVTITARNSIGDKNSAYIRIDTDYKVPDTFDEKRDYIMPEAVDIKVYRKNPDRYPIVTAMGSTFSSEIREGYLSFMVEISGCPDLNKSYVTVDMKNMYLYPDGYVADIDVKEKILLEGEWHLQWKYEYRSNAKTYYMLRPLTIEGQTYYMTKIDISPISVQMTGFRMPWNRQKEYKIFVLDSIEYEDGSKINTKGSTTGGCRNRMWFETFVGILEIGQVVDTKNVRVFWVNGNRIVIE